MFQDFNQILQNNNLLKADNRVLLAVSGGVDSIALFHLMRKIPEIKRPKLSIAHVNHQLRPEADTEEEFVKHLAEKYRIPFYSFLWDKADHPASGIEEAARKIRYSFFKQVMKQQNINVLMTAHHQDDQIETILMKLARGSTLSQLTGIQFSQSFSEGELVRPLLGFSKQELYTFAKEQRLEFIEDETNYELTYTRNRFRNQIIPLLKKENNQFNQHIIQFALDLNDLLEVSKNPIEKAFNQVVKKKQDIWELDIERFSGLTASYQRLAIKYLLDLLYKGEENLYKANYIELIQDWIFNGDVNTQLDLQNDIVTKKEYNRVIFAKKNSVMHLISKEEFVIESVNQWIQLSETEKIGLFVLDESVEDLNNENTLLIDENSLHLPLTIRHRQPGDRMRYVGLNGSKKIKDIFIDEKIPIKKRDEAWIVEDYSSDILWLVTYRKMSLFTVQETDKLTYVLKYKKD